MAATMAETLSWARRRADPKTGASLDQKRAPQTMTPNSGDIVLFFFWGGLFVTQN